jgi:hypothetical protein
MEFRYHPIIENLKINEDGTEILFNGQNMDIKGAKATLHKVVRRILNVTENGQHHPACM